MFPTLLSRRLARLCAVWLALFIVSPAAAPLSAAPWTDLLAVTGPVESSRAPDRPNLPSPVVTFHAVLTEASEESWLATMALAPATLPREAGETVRASSSAHWWRTAGVRPVALVLRV